MAGPGHSSAANAGCVEPGPGGEEGADPASIGRSGISPARPTKLAGNAFDKLTWRQLPGDGVVSFRYKSHRNLRPLIFLPFAFCIGLEGPILNHEMEVGRRNATQANSGNSTAPCIFGRRVRDTFTKEEFCPIFASQSQLSISFAWYGLFLATVAVAWCLGSRIPKGTSGRAQRSCAVGRFLNCERADYDAWHLSAYFAVISLCVVASGISKAASIIPESGWVTCLGYGDWAGDANVCPPGSMLEPTWSIMLIYVLITFAAALSNHGDFRYSSLRWYATSHEVDREAGLGIAAEHEAFVQKRRGVYQVDKLTACAMRLKALVRRQLSVVWEAALRGKTAKEVYLAFYTERYNCHGEKVVEVSFEEDLEALMAGLRGPEDVLRTQDEAQLVMIGNTDQLAWRAQQICLGQARSEFESWAEKLEAVDIFDEYEFCEVTRSLAPETRAWAKCREGPGAGTGGLTIPVLVGFGLGFLGFLVTCLSPLGDKYALTLFLDQDAVDQRCAATAAGAENPWCYAGRSVTVARYTFLPGSDMLPFLGRPEIVVCGALKALICSLLGSLLATILHKTLIGLKQAEDALGILDAILLRWVGDETISLAHIGIWSRTRESILRNDVRNIMHCHENTLIIPLMIALWLSTDATIQVVLYGRFPSILATFVIVLMCGGSLLCLRRATACHLMQVRHAKSLRFIKEATYSFRGNSELQQRRQFLETMATRIEGGWDYQIKLLFLPMNPSFQKTVLGYVALQVAAVIARLGMFGRSS